MRPCGGCLRSTSGRTALPSRTPCAADGITWHRSPTATTPCSPRWWRSTERTRRTSRKSSASRADACPCDCPLVREERRSTSGRSTAARRMRSACTFMGATTGRSCADGTGYDFRRLPYNSHLRVRAGYATAAQTGRAEFTGEFRGLVPPVVVTLRMRASGIDVLRFYGFGNETVDTGSSDFYKVKQQQYVGAPALQFSLSRSTNLSAGPLFKFAHTKLESGTLIDTLRPYGVRDLAQVGAAAAVHVDTRDLPTA